MSSPLTNTYGMLMLALLFTLIFYGVAMILGGMYFRTFPKDRMRVKVVVTILLLFVTLDAASIFAWAYIDLIELFGFPQLLDKMQPLSLVEFYCIFILGFIAQCYFALQIWIISHGNIWITSPALIFAVVQFVSATVQTARSALVGAYSRLGETESTVILEQVFSSAADVYITVVLCILLHHSRSGIKTTDTIITKLIVYAVHRGVITTVLSLLTLALFVWQPATFIFMVPLLPTGQLYAINVLATLLHRQTIRGKPAQNDTFDLNIHFGRSTRSTQRSNGTPQVQSLKPAASADGIQVLSMVCPQSTTVHTWPGDGYGKGALQHSGSDDTAVDPDDSV
ncbi:hypothetical protein CYLTODRAFT_494737 [Cylindrobasidium torrendii FP15055 ss-10]|uniref:DUF6534 domain-containing protein n=1 Tax=Cylindrobasidium torrendii FP15055 ss-10 TaxID=1314674 RepID=A0A0D7AWC8_9AGAR|nr:hypothetical protein CYLTODRAFT_494737 [Cylindrobasidium torrendii FP15055 ss-10]